MLCQFQVLSDSVIYIYTFFSGGWSGWASLVAQMPGEFHGQRKPGGLWS